MSEPTVPAVVNGSESTTDTRPDSTTKEHRLLSTAWAFLRH